MMKTVRHQGSQASPSGDGTLAAPSDSGRARWIDRLARNHLGIALLSALESTFLPIPLEAILAPLMVGRRRAAWGIAAAALVGCIAGSVALFAAGSFLLEPVVEPLLGRLGLGGQLEEMRETLAGDQLFWAVFTVSVSPAPIQIASLGAGAVQGGALPFVTAVALSRGLRYFGLAAAAQLLGPKIERYAEKPGLMLAVALVVALAISVVWALVGG